MCCFVAHSRCSTLSLPVPLFLNASEMGAHFSPCGRYLAACVACAAPPAPSSPATTTSATATATATATTLAGSAGTIESTFQASHGRVTAHSAAAAGGREGCLAAPGGDGGGGNSAAVERGSERRAGTATDSAQVERSGCSAAADCANGNASGALPTSRSPGGSRGSGRSREKAEGDRRSASRPPIVYELRVYSLEDAT